MNQRTYLFEVVYVSYVLNVPLGSINLSASYEVVVLATVYEAERLMVPSGTFLRTIRIRPRINTFFGSSGSSQAADLDFPFSKIKNTWYSI